MAESGKLERAFLAVSEPSSTGAKGAGKPIEFKFNPKEITFARAAEWKSKSSKKPTMPEFVGTKPATVSLEMFFDASEGGDVTADIDKLMSCVEPHKKTTKDKPSPPFVSLGWGSTTYITQAIVKSVSVKYTRFKSDGSPIRAVAAVSLEELRPPDPRQNPTSGGLDAEVERLIGPGDTLPLIAYQELGTPELWRVIADINGIDDPFRIREGTTLIIPSLASIAPENGAR